jgi:hypothetical protein
MQGKVSGIISKLRAKTYLKKQTNFGFLDIKTINPLTPNNLQRPRAVSHLKIKIPIKNSRQAALRGGI